ncbi:MAG TPA: HigA family addiction module antitoxin [Polyangium sp.]|nr:HigA family addiction module antitoxin [Polyangium sp.]
MRNRMRPIHPGEVLREEFVVPLGLSGNALAKALCIPANRINAILKETRNLTADTALRLARFFGTTPEFWMNMQKSYELRLAEIAMGPAIERAVQPNRPGIASPTPPTSMRRNKRVA